MASMLENETAAGEAIAEVRATGPRSGRHTKSRNGLDAPEARNGHAPDPMIPRPFIVQRIHKETHDTFTLELEAADRVPLRFAPGQFNMLYVHGVGEVPISISGDPGHPERLVHTIRAVGTVTRAMESLGEGSVV